MLVTYQLFFENGELRMYSENKQIAFCCSNSPFYGILQKSAQLLCCETGVIDSGWLYLVAVVYLYIHIILIQCMY